MYSIFDQNHPLAINMGVPFVFRFRPPNENTLSELKENYIWFSDRDSLNDELDSNPEFVKLSKDPEEMRLLYDTVAESILDKQVKDYFDRNMDLATLQEFSTTKIKPFISSFGIACFTMYPMNDELWDEYAKDHKGICFHFDSSIDPQFFHNILPMYYVDEINEREFNPISQPDHIVDLFYKKTKKWDKEKELRLLKDRTGRVAFNCDSLLNVILGYNAEPDFVNETIEIVKSNYDNVKVLQAIKPISIGKFSYKPLYVPEQYLVNVIGWRCV